MPLPIPPAEQFPYVPRDLSLGVAGGKPRIAGRSRAKHGTRFREATKEDNVVIERPDYGKPSLGYMAKTAPAIVRSGKPKLREAASVLYDADG